LSPPSYSQFNGTVPVSDRASGVDGKVTTIGPEWLSAPVQ
jgi:hypothetical protein